MPKNENVVGVMVSLDMPVKKFCSKVATQFQMSGGMQEIWFQDGSEKGQKLDD